LDGFDNATDYVVLGAVASIRTAIVEYVVELPVSHRTEVGEVEISHDDSTATVVRHGYSFAEPEITGLTFSADISGGNLRLVFTKSAVGENPTLNYRVLTTPVL